MSRTISNLNRSQTFFPAYYLHPTISADLQYEDITKWMHSFYTQYSSKEFQNIENCPDILFLKPDKTGNYKVDQMAEIYRFQETKPLNGKNKFCVLFPVNEISNVVFNKLLKILEEPLNGLVFFLFDQKKSTLLKTISSRVLEIRLSPEDLELMETNTENSEIQNRFKLLLETLPKKDHAGDWDQFLSLYSENRQEEKQLLGEFTRWVAENNVPPPAFKEKFPSLMQWLENSKLYHNPISERAYFLYQYAGAFSKSL